MQLDLFQLEAALAGPDLCNGGGGSVGVTVAVQQFGKTPYCRGAGSVPSSLRDTGSTCTQVININFKLAQMVPTCQILNGLIRDVAVRHVEVHQDREVTANGADELVGGNVSDVETGEAR